LPFQKNSAVQKAGGQFGSHGIMEPWSNIPNAEHKTFLSTGIAILPGFCNRQQLCVKETPPDYKAEPKNDLTIIFIGVKPKY